MTFDEKCEAWGHTKIRCPIQVGCFNAVIMLGQAMHYELKEPYQIWRDEMEYLYGDGLV